MITSSNGRERLVATRLELVELESRLSPGQTGFGDAFALSLLGPALAGLQLDAFASRESLGALIRRRAAEPVSFSVTKVPAADLTHPALTNQIKSIHTDSGGEGGFDTGSDGFDRPTFPPPDTGGSRTSVVGPNVQTNSSQTCGGGSGVIQSETALAHFNNVFVAGYNDSRGVSCPGLGFQVTGWSYSINRGRSWTDGGPLPGGGSLGGDPWLTVGPTGTFYMSSLYNPLSALAVLRGTVTPTGISWSNPVVLNGAGPDKEAIAVDPNDGNNVYVTFTRFSGGSGIWMYKSTNGGVSFTGPTAVNSQSSPQLQGSIPIVGNNGEVFVVYGEGYPNETGIGFSRSVNGGTTFQHFPNIAPLGDFPAPSGMERAPGFPHIAIDRSGGPNHGNLYVTYHSDHLSGNNNADAVFIRSTDGGLTWSTPTKINDDGGNGLQWFPTINVDSVGYLHSFFYDRRLNPGTSTTNLFYARSTDGGLSWEPNVRITSQSFTMQTGFEFSTTWGDYINADTQGKGAMVAYADGRNGNPDTFFTRVGNYD
jgi:hypothetical protein